MNRGYAYALLASVVVVATAAGLAAPAQERPGEPTKGRMWIENRGLAEAIPVSLQDASLPGPLSVQISGTPTVSLTSGTAMQARLVQQPWEYRSVTVSKGQELASALNGLGAEGWETAGVQVVDPAGTTILLKRPR
jgi:hypothetical protein